MANESKPEKPELISTGLKSVPVSEIVENGVAPGKDVISSDSTLVASSTKDEVDANSSIKVEEAGWDSVAENGVFYPPTSSYNYCYPGSSGPFVQLDDHNLLQADGSHTSVQSDISSLVYYFPGYPYASGAAVGVDGQSVGQQSYYPSPGYHQNPLSFGWGSTYVSNVPNGNADFGNRRHGSASATFVKENNLKAMKDSGNNAGKFPKSAYTPLNKASAVGSDLSAGHFKGYHPGGKSSSFSGQGQGHFLHSGSINYGPNRRAWNGNDINRRDRFNKNSDFEKMTELTCGPRVSNRNTSIDSSDKKEGLGVLLHRDKYNQPDFKIEYTNAKFYVIKSYSEDDIHKSIKYNVWSSTPNGNKKLDAAFCNAEEISSQTGTKCPIFLFFSVNGSGQFVGFAEMVGRVDFHKDLDFWQVDKWHGFFPVQWHVIKDVPNSHLRHIILENNEGSPVTSSRDTQEIFLKQGLQMLTIFNNYSAKTSLLDDFNFYETREKSLRAKKSNKPASLRMEIYENGDFTNNAKSGEGEFEDEWRNKRTADPSSLINLTKNLFLQG